MFKPKVSPPAAKGQVDFGANTETKKSTFANPNVNANEADVAPTFVVEDEVFPDDFSGNDFGEDASAKFTTFEEKPDGSQVEAGVDFEDDVVSSDVKTTIETNEALKEGLNSSVTTVTTETKTSITAGGDGW